MRYLLKAHGNFHMNNRLWKVKIEAGRLVRWHKDNQYKMTHLELDNNGGCEKLFDS